MDAPFPGTCSSGGAQCSNCRDDDGDGLVDGFDPECTGPVDNDEGSFRTGIGGDNVDGVIMDCLYDGNAVAEDDGCSIHVCCVLGARNKTECPLGTSRFDVADCPPPLGTTPLPQQCIDACGHLAPPGCDCFGCCTLCDPQGRCRDVDIHPLVSPNCDSTNVMDPGADTQVDTKDDPCRACQKSETCGSPLCGGTSCIACPGQTVVAGCGATACPPGYPACTNASCAVGSYCANGCCIGTIP